MSLLTDPDDALYDGMIDCLKAARDLPVDDIDGAIELLVTGEWAMALELVCSQLGEYRVPVAQGDYARFLQVGEALGVDVPGLMGHVVQEPARRRRGPWRRVRAAPGPQRWDRDRPAAQGRERRDR